MNRISLIVFALLISCALHTATFAQDREWVDKTGKFKIEATLVKVENGTVTLERADNGKQITLTVAKLSKSDRTFLDSLENDDPSKAPTPGGEEESASPTDDVKVTGNAIWSAPQFDENGKSRFDLQLELICKGSAATGAVEYGMLEIDSIKDSEGNDIKLKESDFSFNDITKGFEKVDRLDSFFTNHPKNGVRLTTDLDADESAKKLIDISGKFKLKTNGTHSTFKIENVASYVGKSIDRNEFEELGVEAEIKIEDGQLSLEFDGSHEPIYSVRAVNSKGKKHKKQFGSSNGGGGELYQYSFSFEDSVPEDVVLEIKFVTDLEEVEIPFSVTDLKIPRKPKRDF